MHHKHKCPNCGTVWEHQERCGFLTSEIFDASHTCPACGIEHVTFKYLGSEVSTVRQECSNEAMEVFVRE